MSFSKLSRQDGHNTLRSLRVKVWKSGLIFLFVLPTGLLARTPSGIVTGTVKTEAGVGIPHAKVVARASGGGVAASVLADDLGHFQLPPIPPGTYKVYVEFPGRWKTAARTLEVREGDHAVLNFVAVLTAKAPEEHSDLLGPVTFYDQSDFKRGELKNPSGGGGYSNAASAQAVKILDQYLAPGESSAAKSDDEETGHPGASTGSHEAELERSGSALLERKDYARAVEVFDKATALYPHSERLQMGLGLSLFGAGKYPEAVVALREAARLAPNDSAPVVMLAETLQFTQDPAAASLVKHFSDLHPENAGGRYAYGLSLWREFRLNHDPETLTGAKTQFEQAVALDPKDADAHLQLGMICDEQNAQDRAIREYLKAVQANPKLAAAHYRLAQDYEHLGKKGKAAAEFAKYEQLRGHASR